MAPARKLPSVARCAPRFSPPSGTPSITPRTPPPRSWPLSATPPAGLTIALWFLLDGGWFVLPSALLDAR